MSHAYMKATCMKATYMKATRMKATRVYGTYIFQLNTRNLIATDQEKEKKVIKIVETFVNETHIRKIFQSIGYSDIKLSYRSPPYSMKKKWFEPTPFQLESDKELEDLISTVEKQFNNTTIPYKVYCTDGNSSDSDTEYEETIRYITLAQNNETNKHFIAIDPEIVRAVRQSWITEYKFIEKYPVYFCPNTIPRNNSKYVNLDCTTETVAKKGIDFHISRFEEIKLLANNQQTTDLDIFLKNKTIKGDKDTLVSKLFHQYHQWSVKHNKQQINLKDFASSMEQLGYEKKRITKGIVMKNVSFIVKDECVNSMTDNTVHINLDVELDKIDKGISESSCTTPAQTPGTMGLDDVEVETPTNAPALGLDEVLKRNPNLLHNLEQMQHHNHHPCTDKDLVLEAVEKDGLQLKYASLELRNDNDVVIKALNNNFKALQFVSEELKNKIDEEMDGIFSI